MIVSIRELCKSHHAPATRRMRLNERALPICDDESCPMGYVEDFRKAGIKIISSEFGESIMAQHFTAAANGYDD